MPGLVAASTKQRKAEEFSAQPAKQKAGSVANKRQLPMFLATSARGLLIESAWPLAQFTSPRSFAGRGRYSRQRISGEGRGTVLVASCAFAERPLTPTLSERALLVSAPQERGEGAHLAC